MEKTLLIKDKVIVFDDKTASRLYNKGHFGSFQDGKLELSLEEALYLKSKKGLEIYDKKGKAMSTKAFINAAEKIQNRFWIRYSVFRDMRTMGYILKTAFKYGGDFRVYDKGSVPGKEHALWILYAGSEHESMPLLSFSAMNRVAHSVKKSVLLGIVDEEGSVTYYEINWRKF
ncbi:MAG: tRNA-intron lyase [Candidatus Parvarchaeota archaeon]|nr:tRNA-intron lyase [Candidatus Parvarchaeota archaeon]